MDKPRIVKYECTIPHQTLNYIIILLTYREHKHSIFTSPGVKLNFTTGGTSSKIQKIPKNGKMRLKRLYGMYMNVQY